VVLNSLLRAALSADIIYLIHLVVLIYIPPPPHPHDCAAAAEGCQGAGARGREKKKKKKQHQKQSHLVVLNSGYKRYKVPPKRQNTKKRPGGGSTVKARASSVRSEATACNASHWRAARHNIKVWSLWFLPNGVLGVSVLDDSRMACVSTRSTLSQPPCCCCALLVPIISVQFHTTVVKQLTDGVSAN